MLIVAALGGNAVSLPGKEGNIAEQYEASVANELKQLIVVIRGTRDDMRRIADDLDLVAWRLAR